MAMSTGHRTGVPYGQLSDVTVIAALRQGGASDRLRATREARDLMGLLFGEVGGRPGMTHELAQCGGR